MQNSGKVCFTKSQMLANEVDLKFMTQELCQLYLRYIKMKDLKNLEQLDLE